MNKVIRDLKTKVQGLADEKEQILGEHQDFVKRRAKLELDIKDLQEEVDGDKSAKVSPFDASTIYFSSAFSMFGLFMLHVLRSCASSIFTCFSYMSLCISSIHLGVGLPMFRCPPTSMFASLSCHMA